MPTKSSLTKRYLFNLLLVSSVLLLIGAGGFLLQMSRVADATLTTSTQVMREALHHQLEQHSLQIAKLIATTIPLDMDTADGSTVAPPLAQLASDPEVASLALYHPHWGYLPIKGEENRFSGLPPRRQIPQAPVITGQAFDNEQSYHVNIVYPLFHRQQPVAALRLEIHHHHIDRELARLGAQLRQQTAAATRENRIMILLFSLGLIPLILLMATRTARSLGKPIETLKLFSQQIAQGNYDARLDIRRHDELGQLAGTLQNMSQQLKQNYHNIKKLAELDSLTELPNRRRFMAEFETRLEQAKQHHGRLALLFIDMDDFKRVNDDLGHDVGDAFLHKFARRLEQHLTPNQFLSRIGGDEFTLLVSDTVEEMELLALAEKLQALSRQGFRCYGHQLHTRLSIGITVYPEDGNTPLELLKQADLAMYEAKKRGKDSCYRFTVDLQQRFERRIYLEKELRQALAQQQITAHYQPVYQLEDLRLIGAEALARWHHPQHGAIAPSEFIPIAEETGMISELTYTLLAQICHAFRHRLDPERFQISINLAGGVLNSMDSIEPLCLIVTGADVDPGAIVLEVTETAAIENVERAANLLGELRTFGFRIWVDDFGTGYSSLNYLHKLPIHGVKIDRSFVAEVLEKRTAANIFKAIVAMAKATGLETLVEGVESEPQLAWSRSQGCQYVQGFLLARPMPALDLETLLQDTFTEEAPSSAAPLGRH